MSLMIFLEECFDRMAGWGLRDWLEDLHERTKRGLCEQAHGKMRMWEKMVLELPAIRPAFTALHHDAVAVGTRNDLTADEAESIRSALLELSPWRKGPLSLFGAFIDAEWRSDLKWNRVKKHASPFKGRLVLDVGCGNGYYGWRMIGAGAKAVIGCEPYPLYNVQFLTFKKYLPQTQHYVLPISGDVIPENLNAFDTALSMGVLYHVKDPISHLHCIYTSLKPGGEIILETMIIDEKFGDILAPDDRYAMMRNVWSIPSPKTARAWLSRAGFKNIRLADITATTTLEQRATEWMTFQSLADFLDPKNPSKTIEGHPAPTRALFFAQK